MVLRAKACSALLLHRRGQQLPVNPDSGIFLETVTTNKSRREEDDELVSSRPTMQEGEQREDPTVSAAETILQPPARIA